MKMITKTLLSLAISTMSIGGAVGLGIAANNNKVSTEPMAAEAAVTYSGKVIVKDNVGWYEGTGSSQAGKAAVYFYNGGNNGWSKTFSLSSGTGKLYQAEYTNLTFNPVNMIVVRLKNSAGASPSWSDQAYGNQTKDLDFAQYTSMDSWSDGKVVCSQRTLTADVRSNQVADFGKKVSLSNVTLGTNPEVYGSVSLALNEEFKVLANDGTWSGYYGRPDALSSCFQGGSLVSRSNDNPNIICKIPGTYDFYFDTVTYRIWISRQDIVDADGWASWFNDHKGCDESGVNPPSGWSEAATKYAALSGDAKDYIYAGTANKDGDNLGKALYWYDYALVAHPSLTKFIEDRNGVKRSTSINRVVQSDNSLTIMMVALSFGVLVTATGLFFFRKKRLSK